MLSKVVGRTCKTLCEHLAIGRSPRYSRPEELVMRFRLLTAFMLLVPCAGATAQGDKTMVELRSGLVNPGLMLAESDKAVHGFHLTAQVDKAGEGKGTLELDPTIPAFDQFGYAKIVDTQPPVKLECSLKFVKKGKVTVQLEPRIGGPEKEVEWGVYEVRGPKITSSLSLSVPTADKWQSGRLLVNGKDGKIRYVVEVRDPGPAAPCHPGCFPAGTLIQVPGGTKSVEQIRKGDPVTTIGADGSAAQTKVVSVFVTKNRLLAVRTDAGDLVTTETQPLALVGGGLRAAGDLKTGDRILRWNGSERRAVTVQSVSAIGRQEPVYNLILGDPALFVANGFLARSKPPAPRGGE